MIKTIDFPWQVHPLVETPFRDPPWLEPRTAYLHVPFCAHHCGYCDFAVTAGHDELIEAYVEALERELSSLGEPHPVETRFIGGGTPTYLNPAQLDRLLHAINRWLPTIDPAAEFSIESTPESLDADKLAVLAQHGVNRVSIGVQSFRAPLLATLDRRHDPTHIPAAVAVVQRLIPTFSFDLIFGTPGQSLADWESDLNAALAYEPSHISTYGLTYEKGTPLWKARQRGSLTVIGEDAELAMYKHAIDRLTAAGFEHYEISNFARPGQQSRHNERYWANEAYFGFGVGAARYIQGRRELNVRDTRLYIQRIQAGETLTFQSECLESRDRAYETIATQLRRAKGIVRERFREQTGFELDDLIGLTIERLVSLELLVDTGSVVSLTRSGIFVADAVITELMKANTK